MPKASNGPVRLPAGLPEPDWADEDYGVALYNADCLAILPQIPDKAVDAVVTDPPYPEIKRDYGRMTEPEWHAMMDLLVPECRRMLTETGSAVYVLQPNSEKIGRMRPWLWEFMAKWTREWGMVQDAWWWNTETIPSAAAASYDLMRSSLKACVWLGQPDCFRNQSAVLWEESDGNRAMRARARCERITSPSGHSTDESKSRFAALRRGGVTPFNVIPMGNDCGGQKLARLHGARTPLRLANWWVRYISAPESVVLDPFLGSGTTGVACVSLNRAFIGIELDPDYFEIAKCRIQQAIVDAKGGPMFAEGKEEHLANAQA